MFSRRTWYHRTKEVLLDREFLDIWNLALEHFPLDVIHLFLILIECLMIEIDMWWNGVGPPKNLASPLPEHLGNSFDRHKCRERPVKKYMSRGDGSWSLRKLGCLLRIQSDLLRTLILEWAYRYFQTRSCSSAVKGVVEHLLTIMLSWSLVAAFGFKSFAILSVRILRDSLWCLSSTKFSCNQSKSQIDPWMFPSCAISMVHPGANELSEVLP